MSIEKTLIGRSEFVSLPGEGVDSIPARIDTGARTTSVWASDIKITEQGLEFCLFGKASPLYTGKKIVRSEYSQVVVSASTGHTQVRYRVPITIRLKDRTIKSFCTLADRSTQAYPLLVGRNTLNGKFIVDVQKGAQTLDALDEKRYEELQSQLRQVQKEKEQI